MKTVITYGTYDLFHTGHYNILKRAKERGDYLIVGVTSDVYDKSRGKLNVKQSLGERIENVKKTGLADKIIVEEYMGQKIDDIIKYNVDEFVLGSDWIGKFDYLREYCEVTYLERTKGVSSTELREQNYGILRLGFLGNIKNIKSIILESKYVSGVEFTSYFSDNFELAKKISLENELENFYTDFEQFIKNVDAVYISDITNAADLIKTCILNKKHVLFERPLKLNSEEINYLYNLANDNGVIIFESIVTAYCPGFSRLTSMLKAGMIGDIKSVDLSYSMQSSKIIDVRNVIATPLLAISKICGFNFNDVSFYCIKNKNKNVYLKSLIKYNNCVVSAQISTNMKLKDSMTIIGTNGYIILNDDWWKTDSYECFSFEKNKKYSFEFDDDGFRYIFADFLNTITTKENFRKVFREESEFISKIIMKYDSNDNIQELK